MSENFIDLTDAVSRNIENEQEYILEMLKNVPSKERYFELLIERLYSGRYGSTPNVHVFVEGISLFGYYKIGWDAAENGTDYEVPKTLYMWDKQVLSELEKKYPEKQKDDVIERISKEAISQYVAGAADAWVYHWLQKEQNNREEEIDTLNAFPSQYRPMLKWQGSINVLYTLFGDLLEKGYIKWAEDGRKGEIEYIKEMLFSHFINEKGKPLSKNTMADFISTATDRKITVNGRIDVQKPILKLKRTKKNVK